MSSHSSNKETGKTIVDTSWDFRDEYTKSSTHGYHTYPAMMIPQIARRLIRTYGTGAKTLLDPFMGSGTAIVEGTLHPQFEKIFGLDINPLAILIAKAKTTPIQPTRLLDAYIKLIKSCEADKTEVAFKQKKMDVSKFYNINFWFKPEAILDLSIIKRNIDAIENKDVRDFFLVAFSETARNVSNTRKNEYKLYRMAKNVLEKHHPTTFSEFRENVEDNIKKMEQYVKDRHKCEVSILYEDSRFKTSIPDNSIDLIVTSPPYGDSRTTVAYGQFSRLSLQWLGLNNDATWNIDRISLGGIPTEGLGNNLKSPTLQKVLNEIAKVDPIRARDVLSFYVDFDKCIAELHRVTRKNASMCFVVGNRTVKGVKIPTDVIITELFQAKNNYEHLNTFIRNIPNKRMPKLNSPTNIKGNHGVTINEEQIVILKRND